MAVSTNGVILARFSGALYNQQLAAATYSELLKANKTSADLNAWANSTVAADFGTKTDLQVATTLITNVGLSSVAGLANWVAGQLTAGGVAKRGETIISLLNSYSNMDTTEAIYGASVATFNTKVDASQALSQTTGNTGGTYAAISTANTALTLTSAVQTSTGTAGDDTFTAAAGAWGTGDIVNGAAGSDTLNATVTGTAPTQSATSLVSIETLNLTASPNPATLDLTGVTGLTSVNNVSSANGASLTVSGLGNVVNTTITGGNTATSVAYTTAATVGLTDAATLSLKGAAAGSTFTTSGVETLTINSGTSANTLTTLSAVGMTKLVITGDQALTIINTVGNSGTTTPTTAYDASAATGAVTLTQTGSGLGTLAAGVTVTGPTAATAGAFTVTTGIYNDTVTLGANANTVSTGAGNDTITSGGGANTITPGAGNDTVNLGAGVDTVRFAEAGPTAADTVNTFGATDVIAVSLGTAATSTAVASATTGLLGIVQTGATTLTLPNVGGTGTGTAISFQAIAPNATATSGTVLAATNVISLNGAYTDGTAAGVITALGTSKDLGITTTAAGKFLLVTYSVGNIAQVWSYGGDGTGTGTVDTNIEALELSLVATLNGVALGGLTAANFATYLTPVAATSTVSNTGQTIALTGTLNTVTSTANTAGQFLTGASDAVTVGVGTLPIGAASATSGLTLIDSSTTDSDVLNVTNLGAATFSGGGILISGIETINANMLVANTTFSAAAITPGTTTFGLTGTQNFVVTALPANFGLTLGAGYTGQGSVQPLSDTGAADTMTLNLSGSTATTDAVGASAIYVANGGATETATVNVSADSSIRLAGTGLLGTVAEVTAVNLTGSGALTVFGSAANLGTTALNGSGVGYTGALTLRPTSNAAMDFSASGVMTGIRTIDLRDAGTFGSTITLAAANNSAAYGSGAVTVSSNVNIGALNVTQIGSGLTDALVVTQSLAAGTVTSITTPGIETLTVNLGGTSGGTTAKTTSIAMDISGATQALTVTSAVPVVLTAVTADSLNTTGVLGSLTATFNVLSLGGSSFTGSTTQASFVTGTGFADVITTGSGNDAIYVAAGGDAANSAILTGGLGNDTYSLLSITSGGTQITDTGGTDTLVLTGAGANISGMNNGATLTTMGIDQLIVTGGTTVTVAGGQITGTLPVSLVTGTTAVNFTLGTPGVLDLSSLNLANTPAYLTAAGAAATAGTVGVVTGAVSTGSTGADSITGTTGADTIIGGTGIDVLTGLDGNDTYSFVGNSQLVTGNAAIDSIVDSAGTTDRILFTDTAATVTIAGTDILTRLTGVEKIETAANTAIISITLNATNTVGTSFNFVNLAGDTNATGVNVISSTGANGISSITGSAGIDTITLGALAPATTVTGGALADTLSISNVSQTTVADTDGITITVQAATVSLITTTTALAATTITGGSGVDTITLAGAVSNVATITGGAGADVINLGATHTGGVKVVFASTLANNGADVITNFLTTVDDINVDAMTTTTAWDATVATTANNVVAGTHGAQAITIGNGKIYLVTNATAGSADTALAASAAISGAADWTNATTGNIAYFIVVDNNSSTVWSMLEAAGAEVIEAEITLMGTIDAVLVSGDILLG
jgi:hypothetical protein